MTEFNSIVVLLLILVASYFISRRFGSKVVVSGAPMHRHWMIRCLGGTLALGLLAAMGVGTWRASGPRADEAEGKVLRPSHEPAPLSLKEDDSWETVQIPPCRLIFTFGVVRRHQGQAMPLIGESKVIEWPADRGRVVRFEQSIRGMDFTCEWTPTDIFQRENDEGRQVLQVRGRMQRTARGNGMGWSSSGGGYSKSMGVASYDVVRQFGGYGHEPLSVVPVAEDDLWLMDEVRRADANDPLKEEPASILAGPMTVDEEVEDRGYGGRRMDAEVPPGARMLAYVGPASALLLVVAIAGSQVFRRRGPAFVALLALMVLFAGAMDLMVWERRVAVINDSARTEQERAVSMASLSRHFFHTGRTVRYLEELRSTKETSPMLREEAGRVLGEMRH